MINASLHYKSDAPTLILGNKRIMPSSDGNFSVPVPLSGEKTEIEVMQIDDFGKVTREMFVFVLTAGENERNLNSKDPTMLSLGLLYTVIAYQEAARLRTTRAQQRDLPE